MSVVTGLGPMNFDVLTDDELVGFARAGDEQAFNVIVRRYRPPLVSYCRRWLDPHRAEEVVQQTLMKAFLVLRDDDRPLALRPWLYRVAHNAALNALEKKGGDWEELDENYDGVPQPPQVAEKRAHFLNVVHEIEALPERQREALVLNEFEGRCYAEIATQLGTSESGVRGLLRRARRQLRETAAAVLLPFPALREILRADGGRSFQADRAGEMISTAGAAGGLGAAGGFAKVAAGVLAAGTIAGGGTALEQGREVWKTTDAQAKAPVIEHSTEAGTATARELVQLAVDSVSLVPARATAPESGAGAVAHAAAPVEHHGAEVGSFETQTQEEPETPIDTPINPDGDEESEKDLLPGGEGDKEDADGQSDHGGLTDALPLGGRDDEDDDAPAAEPNAGTPSNGAPPPSRERQPGGAPAGTAPSAVSH